MAPPEGQEHIQIRVVSLYARGWLHVSKGCTYTALVFPVCAGTAQANRYIYTITYLFALVAQGIEHLISNQVVVGSNPTWGT